MTAARRVRMLLIQYGGYSASQFQIAYQAGHIRFSEVQDVLGYVRTTQANWRDVQEYILPGWKKRDAQRQLEEEHRREFDGMFAVWEAQQSES